MWDNCRSLSTTPIKSDKKRPRPSYKRDQHHLTHRETAAQKNKEYKRSSQQQSAVRAVIIFYIFVGRAPGADKLDQKAMRCMMAKHTHSGYVFFCNAVLFLCVLAGRGTDASLIILHTPPLVGKKN
jgi:hypothetical protein